MCCKIYFNFPLLEFCDLRNKEFHCKLFKREATLNKADIEIQAEQISKKSHFYGSERILVWIDKASGLSFKNHAAFRTHFGPHQHDTQPWTMNLSPLEI